MPKLEIIILVLCIINLIFTMGLAGVIVSHSKVHATIRYESIKLFNDYFLFLITKDRKHVKNVSETVDIIDEESRKLIFGKKEETDGKVS